MESIKAMTTLHLTLKRKWFDMIASGKKKEEYREIKSFWIKRLISEAFNWDCETSEKRAAHYVACPNGFYKKFDVVRFRNGYAKDAPVVVVECLGIARGEANPEWISEKWNGDFFIVKLGKILNQTNTMKGQVATGKSPYELGDTVEFMGGECEIEDILFHQSVKEQTAWFTYNIKVTGLHRVNINQADLGKIIQYQNGKKPV